MYFHLHIIHQDSYNDNCSKLLEINMKYILKLNQYKYYILDHNLKINSFVSYLRKLFYRNSNKNESGININHYVNRLKEFIHFCKMYNFMLYNHRSSKKDHIIHNHLLKNQDNIQFCINIYLSLKVKCISIR